ncbi:MAG: hypothetical protein H6600_06750 [Flavobacteriales bacterium]|nr:hypothetical protein [Flavobacteriales bacterium]
MIRILGVIFLIVISIYSYGTQTVDLDYNYEYLDLHLTYNDGENKDGDRLEWHYEGLSKQLNEFLETKIKNGELDDKKFNINYWLYDVSTCDCCPIEISQNKNGYYLAVVGDELSLHRIVQIINYFSSNYWESFVCKEPKKYQDVADKTLFHILDKTVGDPDLSFFKSKSTTVFELNDLRIDYRNDSLVVSINGNQVKEKINFKGASVPPVSLGEYYIVASYDSIYVYDGVKVINSCSRQLINNGLSKMKSHNKWMNYYDEYDCVLSYSLEKNRFYYLKN